MNPQVMTCINIQNVLRQSAILASRTVRIGTSGLSSSVCPIKCPVALAQIFSMLFTESLRPQRDYKHTSHRSAVHRGYAMFLRWSDQR